MAVRRKKHSALLAALALSFVAIGLVICFLTAISNVENGRTTEDKQRLEEVLKEAAVACYSVEGIYPPSLEYLEEHYGVQIDRRHFVVRYTPIAENLMPDITVLEK